MKSYDGINCNHICYCSQQKKMIHSCNTQKEKNETKSQFAYVNRLE